MSLTIDKKYTRTKYKVYEVEDAFVEQYEIDNMSPYDLVFSDGLRIRSSAFYCNKDTLNEIPHHFLLDQVDVKFVDSIENEYHIPRLVASLEDFIKCRRKNRKKKIYVRYFKVCSVETKFFFVDDLLEIIPLVLNQHVAPLSKYDNRIQEYQEQYANCPVIEEEQFKKILCEFDVNCEFLTLIPDIWYITVLKSVKTVLNICTTTSDRSFNRFAERRHAVLFLILNFVCGSNLKEGTFNQPHCLAAFRSFTKKTLNQIISSRDVVLPYTELEAVMKEFTILKTFAEIEFERNDDFMTDRWVDKEVHRDAYINACKNHMVSIKLDTQNKTSFKLWQVRYYFIIGSIEAVYNGADFGDLVKYILPALVMKSPKEEWDRWFEEMKNSNESDLTSPLQNEEEKPKESQLIGTSPDQQIDVEIQRKDEKQSKSKYSDENVFPSPAESEEEEEQQESIDSNCSDPLPIARNDSEKQTSSLDSYQPSVQSDATSQADVQIENEVEEQKEPELSANALEQQNGVVVETLENASFSPETSSTNKRHKKKHNQVKIEKIVYVETCRNCTKNKNRNNYLEIAMIKTTNQMKDYEEKMKNANTFRIEETELRLKEEQRATMFEKKAMKTMDVENELKKILKENERLQKQISLFANQSDTIKNMEQKILKLKAENKKLEKTNKKLRDEKIGLSDEVSNLSNNLASVELALVNKTIELQESNEECETLFSKNTENQKAISSLLKNNARTKEKLCQLMNINARLCQNHALMRDEVSKVQESGIVSEDSWNDLKGLATLPEEFSVSECFCRSLEGTFQMDSECEICHKYFHYNCIRIWHKEVIVLPDGTRKEPSCPFCMKSIALRR